MARPRVGVLALQGDFDLHTRLLGELDVDATTVRRVAELDACDALVLPGGESTTLVRLLRINELEDPLRRFAAERPLLGTCAGLILMASELIDAGGVEPLGLLDVTVRRNGFGRQVDSFETEIQLTDPAQKGPARGTFIRAPRITRVGDGVEVLAVQGQEPVAVGQGRHVGLTFHPELGHDPRWHRRWLAAAGLGSG